MYIDPSALPGLWWTGTQLGPNELEVRAQLDGVLQSARSECNAGAVSVSEPVLDLKKAMGFAEEIPIDASSETSRNSDVSATVQAFATATTHDTQVPTLPPEPPALPKPADSLTQIKRDSEETRSLQPGLLPIRQDSELTAPRSFIGWSSPTTRWSVLGKLATTNEPVALDLDNPGAIGIFWV